MKARGLVTGAFGYAGLHLLWWWAVLSSNGHEAWAPVVNAAAWLFLPLELISLAACNLVWGTTNIFKAKVVFGLWADIAIIDVVSVGAILVALGWWRRRGALATPRM
jgi:hypothetical protein